MVLQLRALGPSWSVSHVADRDKGSAEHLCHVPLPVCEVPIPILEWADDIFTLPFAIDMFEKNSIFLSPTVLTAPTEL